MRNILLRIHRHILQQFAESNVLLAFDFDGTLAPIVLSPTQAQMRPATRRLFEKLARLYPCIVISGRTRLDTQKRLHGIRVLEVVGNHGVEPWAASHQLMEKIQQWRPSLEERFASLPGVRIEDKIFSLTVHYRQSTEKKRARAAILDAAQLLGDVRLLNGKQVVNILPNGLPHKGTALERERVRLHCKTAIYVGDDETDEDVFALGHPDKLLTIRVGRKITSAASFFIENQMEIDRLLQALVQLRQR
jgi:trehalose 6-phosphate phosphatase